MAKAYGGCIEPDGMELDDEHWTIPCPRCSQAARAWRVERAEGSLNTYSGLSCSNCGHEQGDRPGHH